MAREVDGDERSIEGQGHGVPRVGVLRTPVEQDQLGLTDAPHERAEPPGLDLDALAPHDRWTGEREVELGGILVEQGELVVGRRVGHAGASVAAARASAAWRAARRMPW